MGIKARRQYGKPHKKGRLAEGKPHQNGESHATGHADSLEAAAGHGKSGGHANGLAGTAEGAGGQANSEAHANGMGFAQEAVPTNVHASASEPDLATPGALIEEQQRDVKRQRVEDEGALL